MTMTWISLLEALDEERADRPVDQAGGQHLLLGGARLALEEAARDLAGGVGLLLVVDGQREEVLAGLRASSRRRRWRARWSRRRWRRTAASAWRAILPVSSVSVSWPHSMDFLTMLNMSLPSYRRADPLARRRATRGRIPRGPLACRTGDPSGSEGPGCMANSGSRRAAGARARAPAARPGGQRRMPRRPISDW